MGLYPDLEQGTTSQSQSQSPPKPQSKVMFKNMDRLAFSSASQAVPNFETINDKVLREMNERAKKQLENKVETTTNPFKLGDTSKVRSPQRQRPSSGKRFSLAHRTQFSRMESIESHPKVVAKNSRRDLRADFTREAASPAKRSQTKPEESPTKRLRRQEKTISGSSCSGSLAQKPELKPEATFMKRSETSERVRARASMRNLRAPALAAPKEMVEREPTKSVSAPVKAPERTLRRSARVAQSQDHTSMRTLGTLTSPSKLFDQSSFGSDMSMDNSTMTVESPGANAPLPALREKLAEFPQVPRHLPSYARPTASAIRRSQSQQTIGDTRASSVGNIDSKGPKLTKRDPRRIASMFRDLARVPRRDPRV